MSTTLRTYHEDDVALLFNWANDPTVRLNSIQKKPIEWEEHLRWIKDKLMTENSLLFILEDSLNCPVGQIRFDLTGNYYTIHYSVASEFRGQGYGFQLLIMGIERVGKDKEYRATVREDNASSIRVFYKAGFVLENAQKIGDENYLILNKK